VREGLVLALQRRAERLIVRSMTAEQNQKSPKKHNRAKPILLFACNFGNSSAYHMRVADQVPPWKSDSVAK
jgi:hypothetical protein